jgi:hypothetical protein
VRNIFAGSHSEHRWRCNEKQRKRTQWLTNCEEEEEEEEKPNKMLIRNIAYLMALQDGDTRLRHMKKILKRWKILYTKE